MPSEYQRRKINEATIPKGHIPALDAVRGLAILPVMLYHFTIGYKHDVSSIFDISFIRICGAGWLGVDLFFVLSGFLITGILYDTLQSPKYFMSFYGRRFLRIFPLYYAILITSFFVLPGFLPLGPSKLNVLLDNKWWFLSYLINWKIAYIGDFNAIPAGYIWSLAIEEQFYLIWPLIIYVARSKQLQVAAWLLAGTIAVRFGLLLLGATPTSVYVLTVSHLDGLLIGSIISLYLRTNTVAPGFHRHVKTAIILPSIAIFIMFIQQKEFYFYTLPVAYIGYLLLSVCFGGLLSTAIFSRISSVFGRIVNSKVLCSFGKYSYCLYLIHHPVGTALEKFVFNPRTHLFLNSLVPALILFIILSTMVCWTLAYISWHLYEKQFIKLKKYFSY